MVRAISEAVRNRISRHIRPAASVPQAAGNTDNGYYWHMMPDVSDEVARRITKASAWMAWGAINRQVHQQRRRGKTASIKADAKAGRIGVGLRQLARSVGADVSTVRRQCRRLEELGLIVMHRPSTVTVRDADTGRITTKSLGRCKATMIYLTVTEAHGRPSRDGGNLPPSPAACKAQSATTSKEEKNIEPPCVDAVGIGTTTEEVGDGLSAVEAGRHPPAKAGGHTAARASTEGVMVLGVNADAHGVSVDEPPAPPPCTPRRSKAAGGRQAGTGATRRPATESGHTGHSGAFPEDHAEPRPFTGKYAEAAAAQQARLAAERAAEERRNPPALPPWKRRQAAAEELRQAAACLPAEAVERAADVRLTPEAEDLLNLLRRRREEMGLKASSTGAVR